MVPNSHRNYSRVVMGGAFNLPRVKYSKETQELLKVMMEECQLTMMKRRELSKYVTNGESLPNLASSSNKHSNSKITTVELKIQPVVCKKRTKDKIIEMGAYEREKFKATNKASSSDEKRRLQSMMAYGTVAPQKSDRAGRAPPRASPAAPSDRVEELVQEIRDRCQFLQDVTELGQGEKYRAIMHAEIASKLNALRSLDALRCEEIRRELHLPTRASITLPSR